MDAGSYFNGKKITVMGMGLLGGVGDIRYLAEQGAELTVTDLKRPEDLTPSLEALKAFPNIRYTLGRHDLADFCSRDLVIKAPSTPLTSPYIAEAKKNGIPVTMWAALFSRFAHEAGATVVGITGTRGKTTVTAFIADTLSRAGRQVITGGNVAGTAMLPNLPNLTRESVVVLELDSWKLQGFAEEKLSPDVAVFTTFFPDHLNYYGDDLAAYLSDKANIFRFQKEEDVLVLGSQCEALVKEKHGSEMHGRVAVVGEDYLPAEWKLAVPGMHNRYNAALAYAALTALGVPASECREAFAVFPGVPGRLELLGEKNGVRFYNDTTATTPVATLAALRALGGSGAVRLIMGGSDKGIDMQELIAHIPQYAASVYLLAGTGTKRLEAQMPDAPIFERLEDAFVAAVSAAQPGDAVLLSPAFASFGMFKNEYDRGDQFTALVRAL